MKHFSLAIGRDPHAVNTCFNETAQKVAEELYRPGRPYHLEADEGQVRQLIDQEYQRNARGVYGEEMESHHATQNVRLMGKQGNASVDLSAETEPSCLGQSRPRAATASCYVGRCRGDL